MHGVLQVFVGCFDSQLLANEELEWIDWHAGHTLALLVRSGKSNYWAQLVVFSRLCIQCACQGLGVCNNVGEHCLAVQPFQNIILGQSSA